MRSRGLNKKHLKALELLKDVGIPTSEVSRLSGLSKDHIKDLKSGHPRAGAVAEEFSAEYHKEMEEQDKRIQKKAKALKEMMIGALEVWFTEEKKNKRLQKDVRKTIVDTIKALSLGPTYNIGSVSYSKGLSPEDMISEFKRLGSISSDGGAVQKAEEGRSGVLSVPSGAGDQAQEGQEASGLSAEP